MEVACPKELYRDHNAKLMSLLFVIEMPSGLLNQFDFLPFSQALEKGFENFVKEVETLGKGKVQSLNQLTSGLLKESHGQSEEIKKKAEEVNRAWDALCRAIQNRAKVTFLSSIYFLY